ncbi:CDC45-like protein, partial [Helicosporidium sp. ATCC 50920]
RRVSRHARGAAERLLPPGRELGQALGLRDVRAGLPPEPGLGLCPLARRGGPRRSAGARAAAGGPLPRVLPALRAAGAERQGGGRPGRAPRWRGRGDGHHAGRRRELPHLAARGLSLRPAVGVDAVRRHAVQPLRGRKAADLHQPRKGRPGAAAGQDGGAPQPGQGGLCARHEAAAEGPDPGAPRAPRRRLSHGRRHGSLFPAPGRPGALRQRRGRGPRGDGAAAVLAPAPRPPRGGAGGGPRGSQERARRQ